MFAVDSPPSSVPHPKSSPRASSLNPPPPEALWSGLDLHLDGKIANKKFLHMAGNGISIPTVGMLIMWILGHSTRVIPPQIRADAPLALEGDDD